MKYLKRYNESNDDDIVSNCKDILLELDDIGFETIAKRVESEIHIFIYKREVFTYEDIEDTHIRLKDYLGGIGFKPNKTNKITQHLISKPHDYMKISFGV